MAHINRTKIDIPFDYERPSLKVRIAKALGYISIGIITYAVILLAAFEFMVGCGTTTYNADGTYYTNECLFVPYTPVEGRWK